MRARCVASTGDTYRCTISATAEHESRKIQDGSYSTESNLFKSAQWTPDGTSILTSSEDNAIRNFILPIDLLSDSTAVHDLKPYCATYLPEPVYALCAYPHYSLASPVSACFLASVRDHPIRLQDALISNLRASYRLVMPSTEQVVAPHSLIFSRSGEKFMAGSDSLLTVFDVSRDGEGPIGWFPTIPSKRKTIVGGGVGIKGIISTLDLSCEDILVAGTFNRSIGLYDSEGSGDCIAVFNLIKDIKGGGITQVKWDETGRYLFVAERRSCNILMYDVRVAGRLVATFEGRQASGNQRLSFDVKAREIWAGGEDGAVKVYSYLEPKVQDEHPIQISNEWEFPVHEDSVSSTAVHPSGVVIATCSGARRVMECGDEPSAIQATDTPAAITSPDNTLKIWQIEASDID